MKRLLWWTALLITLLLAWNLRTPYTNPLRNADLLIVLAAAAALYAARKSRVQALLAIAAAILGAAQEVYFRGARATVLEAQPWQLERLGPHLIVGFDELEEVELLASRGAIGGVFLTQKNVRGKSPEEVRAMIDRLRAAAAGRIFFVAADQEGGEVSRLTPPLPARPPLATFAGSAEEVRAFAEAQGRELAALGVDVNFSPVLDLRREEMSSAIDFHSKIADRAIASDPQLVATTGALYARGLFEHGVFATLKHFPGLGRAASDTHHFDAAITASKEELEGTDFHPFRAVLAETDAFLMLGHARVEALDPEHHASHSDAIVGGLIRREWEHQGILVTDDVCMAPFYYAEGGVGGSAVRALNAGVDLLLVAYDERQYYRVMAALMTAERLGRLDQQRLSLSHERLRRAVDTRLVARANR
jgi:beta-N-acetylhexosaminidase